MKSLTSMAIALTLILAAAATGPTSSLAASCVKHVGSHQHAVCVEGQLLGSSTETKTEPFIARLLPGTKAVLNGQAAMLGEGLYPIGCELVATGFLQSGKGVVKESGVRVSLNHCAYLSEPAKEECEINETSQSTELEGTLSSTGYSFKYSGSEIGHLQILGCSFWGSYSVFGTLNAALLSAETEQAQHVLKGEPKRTLTIEGRSNELTFEAPMELYGSHKGQRFSLIES